MKLAETRVERILVYVRRAAGVEQVVYLVTRAYMYIYIYLYD